MCLVLATRARVRMERVALVRARRVLWAAAPRAKALVHQPWARPRVHACTGVGLGNNGHGGVNAP